jgi:hypothetical protein
MNALQTNFSEQVAWSINADLHAWTSGEAVRLGMSFSVLMRSFCCQMQAGEPAMLQHVPELIDQGMRDVVLEPKLARIYLDVEQRDWLMRFIRDLKHPKFPHRKVWLRHLMNGYLLWLRQHGAPLGLGIAGAWHEVQR